MLKIQILDENKYLYNCSVSLLRKTVSHWNT